MRQDRAREEGPMAAGARGENEGGGERDGRGEPTPVREDLVLSGEEGAS